MAFFESDAAIGAKWAKTDGNSFLMRRDVEIFQIKSNETQSCACRSRSMARPMTLSLMAIAFLRGISSLIGR